MMARVARLAGVLAALWLTAVFAPGPSAVAAPRVNGERPPGYLHIVIVDGLASVDALDARLIDVLAEFTRQSGHVLAYGSSADDRITTVVDRLPLSQALARILRHHSFVLWDAQRVLHPSPAARANAGKLWVLPASAEAAVGASAERGQATVANSEEPVDPEFAALTYALSNADVDGRRRVVDVGRGRERRGRFGSGTSNARHRRGRRH